MTLQTLLLPLCFFFLFLFLPTQCTPTFLPNTRAPTPATPTNTPPPPHIVFLLVDDLGFNNVPWSNGSVAVAPHAAALFAGGIRLASHYVQRWCTPTRASLMSGRYPFRVGWNQFSTTFAEELSALPLSFELLPSVLRRAPTPYATHMLGKWHLGHFSQDHTPVGRGFDSYFGFLLGSETHDTHASWGRHTCDMSVTDLYNCSRPAKDSVHYRNMTYSPEMYAAEAERIIDAHAAHNRSSPLFLHMCFQNNHAPYSAPTLYLNEFPKLPASGNRHTYNAMMFAVDAAIGRIVGALARHADVFGNNTLIIFTSDNGGPAKEANNYPLRGAKFGLFEGSFRTNAFVHAPGVLTPPAAFPTRLRASGPHTTPTPLAEYTNMMHVSDWYATLADAAGNINTSGTGPPGFASPDGVSHWPNLKAVLATSTGGAANLPPPRTEIVHDLDFVRDPPFVAVRSGNYKLIYGNIGDSDWIMDDDYPCADCCPFRRPPLPSDPKPAECGGLDLQADWHPASAVTGRRNASLKCTEQAPCLFNVAGDPLEEINLASDAAHKATLAALQQRVAFHRNQTYTAPIDHTNFTSAQYCSIVQKAQWVAPFGYAPARTPASAGDVARLVGVWAQTDLKEPVSRSEWFRIERAASPDPNAVVITAINCTGCCWNTSAANGSAYVVHASAPPTVVLDVITARGRCDAPRHELGTFGGEPSRPILRWEAVDEAGSDAQSWKTWEMVANVDDFQDRE